MHIACHGVTSEAVKDRPMHRRNLSSQADPEDAGLENAYLIFESNDGDAEAIDGLEFKNIMKRASKKQLIILQSCDSEEIGKLFVRHGALNVICIEKGRKVLDEAAIIFSRNLYQMLFKGYSVEHAFKEARDLTRDELGSDKEHEVELFVHIKDQSQESVSLFTATDLLINQRG